MNTHGSARTFSPSFFYIFLAVAIWPCAATKALRSSSSLANSVNHDSKASRGLGHAYELGGNTVSQSIRKMSSDPGEMFFYDYWGSESQDHGMSPEPRGHDIQDGQENITARLALLHAPFLLHEDRVDFSAWRWTTAALGKRGFTCPAGTDACLNIGRPNSCCSNGLTCSIVEDSGLGDVACCPSANGCSGHIGSCPTGYTTCSDEQGGGCCIPGYQCEGAGCVQTSTKVVVVGGKTIYSSSESQTSSTQSSTSTSICSSGFNACAASLGGGCCPPDKVDFRLYLCQCSDPIARRPKEVADNCEYCLVCTFSALCAPKTSLSSSQSTGTIPAPPVRGTSGSNAATTSTSQSTQVPTSGPCPSNFYPCSAYYPGAGCCQIGRDCASTSCPPRTTISKLASNGVTILEEPTVGACATGWSSCGANIGGGCCPTGYSCGTASCMATASITGPSAVTKESIGSRINLEWGHISFAVILVVMWQNRI